LFLRGFHFSSFYLPQDRAAIEQQPFRLLSLAQMEAVAHCLTNLKSCGAGESDGEKREEDEGSEIPDRRRNRCCVRSSILVPFPGGISQGTGGEKIKHGGD
jgi:hypothetical protein